MQKNTPRILAQALILAAVLILAIFGIKEFVGNDDSTEKDEQTTQESILAESTAKQIEVVVDNGDQVETYATDYSSDMNAFDFLEKLQNENEDFTFGFTEFEFGAMVTEVNEEQPGENQFWKFQINGDDAQVGVSDYMVNEGDVLSFVLDEIQF